MDMSAVAISTGWVCPGGEYPPPDMRPGIPQDMVGKRVVCGW